MAVTINASTSAGLVQTADTTGNLSLQSNGTTIAALTSTGLAVTGAGTFSTTLGVTGTSTLAAVNASGIFTTSDTTAATSAITGSIKTAGGLGVLKGIFVGSSSSRGTIDITGTSGAGPSLTFNDNQSGAQTYITGAVAANEYDIFDSTRGAYVLRATNTGAVTIPGTLGVTGLITGSANGKFLLANGATTGSLYADIQNTGGRLIIGVANSAGTSPITSSTAYSVILNSDNGTPIELAISSVTQLKVLSTGVTIPGTLQVGVAIQITTSNAPQVTPTGFYMNTWPTTASPANTNVANGEYARIVTSLRANKTEISSISEQVATNTVMAMRGVTYRSAIDEDQREWAGFIAEETKEANPILAMFDSLGDLQSISYDRIPAYMIPVLQKHEREIQALRAEIQQLRNPQ